MAHLRHPPRRGLTGWNETAREARRRTEIREDQSDSTVESISCTDLVDLMEANTGIAVLRHHPGSGLTGEACRLLRFVLEELGLRVHALRPELEHRLIDPHASR